MLIDGMEYAEAGSGIKPVIRCPKCEQPYFVTGEEGRREKAECPEHGIFEKMVGGQVDPQSFVDEEGVTHKLSPLRFEPGDVRVRQESPTSGIGRLEVRIDRLEALVKRIATHLGIDE